MKIPFVGPCYSGRSPYWDGQESINLMVETDEAGGKSSMALVGTPGLVAWLALPEVAEVRGALPCGDGNLYVVCGSMLYRVTPAKVATHVGTLATSSGIVSMAQNGDQLMIADNPNGYLLTFNTGSFSKIANPNFPGASTVAFVDGYFVVSKPDSEQFFLSGLYDGSVWDGLAWASAQGRPDNLVCLAVSHRETWLLGQSSTEVWYNAGIAAPEFPFDRISGAFSETGCSARMSAAVMDNTIFWLTDKGQVVRASGYAPQIVSTRQMEFLFSQYETWADAFAFSYVQSGHTFYVLTFPSAGRTWVYDAATGLWHRRRSYGQGRWRANCYAKFAGLHLVGDASNGKLYQLSETAYSEDGDILEAIRVTAPISGEGERLFMSSLQVDFETGVGTVSGQGQDPQAMLEWSDDGGRTWSNIYTASMGKLGQYNARTIWRRLGSFRNRQFRLSVTDPVRRIILGAFADVKKGSN